MHALAAPVLSDAARSRSVAPRSPRQGGARPRGRGVPVSPIRAQPRAGTRRDRPPALVAAPRAGLRAASPDRGETGRASAASEYERGQGHGEEEAVLTILGLGLGGFAAPGWAAAAAGAAAAGLGAWAIIDAIIDSKPKLIDALLPICMAAATVPTPCKLVKVREQENGFTACFYKCLNGQSESHVAPPGENCPRSLEKVLQP